MIELPGSAFVCTGSKSTQGCYEPTYDAKSSETSLNVVSSAWTFCRCLGDSLIRFLSGLSFPGILVSQCPGIHWMDGCVACWLLLVCPWQSVVCAVINPSILSEFSNDYKLCKHIKTIDKSYRLYFNNGNTETKLHSFQVNL